MEQIEFGKLKYFSNLFKDFIDSNEFITNRFPSNNLFLNNSASQIINNEKNVKSNDNFDKQLENSLNSEEIYKFEECNTFFKFRTNETFNKRPILIDAIRKSMQTIELSEQQRINLNYLDNENTLAVVTGQQPGFLGGPLYTILKSISAIIKTKELNDIYNNFKFIPVFWVEDNDHDLEESSTAVIYDKNYQPVNLKLPFDEEGIAAYQIIENTFTEKLEKIIEILPVSDLGAEFVNELKTFYKAGNTWSDSFIAYNSYLTERFGMLFVKSSELSNTGVFKDLIIEEILNPGIVKSIVELSSNQLLKNGYHIQANSSEINLFFHKKSLRHRIEFTDNKYYIDEIELSKSEILEIAEKVSGNFSPKVLLRPIFQDYIIPTAVYVGGPGEIAYLAQIKEIYKYFNLTMPVINARHSATLIDKSTSRGLEKFKLKTEYFMRDSTIIEMELASELIDGETEEKFADSSKSIKNIFENLIEYIKIIDPQIEKTASTTFNKIDEQMENLKKKTISLLKRQEEDKFNKFKKMSNFIYPNKTPQERHFSSANFISQVGLDNFLFYLFKISQVDANKHVLINLFEN